MSSELIVARQGLGYLIGYLGANGSYEPMFAVVLTVAFLGFAADRVYQMIVRTGAAMARIEDALPPTDVRGAERIERALSASFWFLARWILIALMLIAWEALARSGTVTPFMLPPLSTVLQRIWSDALSGDLAMNAGVTLYRALAGFFIAATGGVILGMLMARNAAVRWFFDPIISVVFPSAKDRLPADHHPVARLL